VFQKILRRVARELKQASIPYMVIGGQAVLVYGEPRLTRDIDVTLGIGVRELAKIKKLLPAMSLKVLVKNDQEFVERTMVLPTKDRESDIRVDFIFSFSPYERQAIGRAKNVRVGRTQVKFASLEDLVIHKVVSGRPRDLEDIKSILAKNPKYDSEYISKWLREFDQSLNQHLTETFKKMEEEIRDTPESSI
jgi:predicted nucleotidyltransferase